MKWLLVSTQVLAKAFGFEARKAIFKVESGAGQSTEERDYVHHNGTVTCVLLDQGGRVALERIYRPLFAQHQYELPAGGIDDDESPEQAIVRELREELGAEVSDLKLLRVFQNAPGHTDQLTHIFQAQVASLNQPDRQGVEESELSVHWLGKDELRIMLHELNDAKTIIGVQLWIG